MSLESFIETYGYFAVVVGTFFEGETILLMAGFAANRGYLSLRWVILLAFVGSFLGDQVWFYVGRKKGRHYLENRMQVNERIRTLMAKFERYQLTVVLGFRFVYGLRNITPVVIGASGFSPKRFMVLNAVSAIVWTVAISVAGYFFGHAMERLFHDIKVYEGYLLLTLATVGGLAWAILGLRQRRLQKKGSVRS